MPPHATDPHSSGPAAERLAAIVLHVLISDPDDARGVEQVALACQRDPTGPADLDAVAAALLGLAADGLAEIEGDRFRASRAASRSEQLRF